VDWSARAIYTNELGWFDGKAHLLYAVAPEDRARRTVALMGGVEAVTAAASAAAAEADHAWALELYALAEAASPERLDRPDALDQQIATSLEALGATIANTNGRGYLLQSALERRADFVASIPLPQIFGSMGTRLRPDETMDRHDSVHFVFTDTQERYVVTIRRGIAEVVAGDPLPGTPAPLATLTTDAMTWRKLALGIEEGADAIKDGRLAVDGSELGLLGFLNRFDKGLDGPGGELP